MAQNILMNPESFRAACEQTGVSLPFGASAQALAQPLQVGSKRFANRIVYQAMEGCDGTAEGVPGELTRRRYLRFAGGGAGLIWFEATAVVNEGRANPRQMFLNENTLDAFRNIVEEIKETCLKENGFEPVVFCQLTHSGRYSKPNGVPEPIIAYHNPVLEEKAPVDDSRIISDDELDRVSEKLAAGALLAQKAGFDGADIKSCHRYLLSELLSAYQRPGKYGGSFENRTRMLRQTAADAVSRCSRDFIITSRLNAYDGLAYPNGFGVSPDGGTEPELSEAIALVQALEQIGMPMIDITMGNPYFNPHINRPFAAGTYDPPEHPLCGVARMLTGTAKIRRAVGIPLICSGISWLGAVSPNVTAACIDEGWFDFAGYGRESIAYPDAAKDICTNGALDPKKLCITCGKCTEIMRAGGTPGCVVRDSGTYLPLYRQFCRNK
ncbi:MAG: NADH:flavin oxidoreductase [Firmicutes bacterium]|nr:NADH:flavin oxidoreductase [Bacillota bacterium]